MSPERSSLTTQLAEHWSRIDFEELPEEVVRAAKRFLLDTLAAGLAGAKTQVARSVREALAFGSRPSDLVIWGTSDRLSPPQAALANGTAAHALELDDFDGCGHSGAVVIPAVCATAELIRASGREVLVAIVAGYDLAARVLEGAGGYLAHNERGWHSTGTCGSFGAAAATAKLLSLDPERFADALGIAGSFTGGTWAFLADGAMTKRFHTGKASENGLTAALLARAGMSGPRFVLEAEWGGFFGTYSADAATPEATLSGLGSEFRLLRSGLKAYACCRGIHGPLDSLFELMRETGFAASDIERMVVHGSERTRLQFSRQTVNNLLDAQFSLPYCLAVAAASGRASLDQFVPLRNDKLPIRRLMGATEVLADRSLGQGENPELEVQLTDGRHFRHRTERARGAPEKPLSDEEVFAKAQGLMAPVVGEERFQEIAAFVDGLEGLEDFRLLSRLLLLPEAP